MKSFELNNEINNIKNIIAVMRYGVYRKTTTGWHIDTRTIDDHEFVLVDKGSGWVNIEGVEYSVEPGMLFYFYPGLIHSLRTNDRDTFSFYAIHFSFTFFKKENQLWSVIPGGSKLPISTMQRIPHPGIYFDALKKTIDHFNKSFPGWELSTRFNLESFIYKLIYEVQEQEVNYGARMKIDIIAKYINDNIEKKFELNMLAKQVSVTEDYLSRIFKNYTGYSLTKYINRSKIQQAKILLLEGNLKIKEIAAFLGFFDEFHFSKVFKRIEGVSPRNFVNLKDKLDKS